MNNGEIVFDMNEEQKPTGSVSSYMLKRWRRYSIYAKSGSNNRTDNPRENLYSTCSIYLYDYVSVSKEYYSSMIYTASYVDSTPAEYGQFAPGYLWTHRDNTFKNTPNLITSNYRLTSSAYIGGVNEFVYDTLMQTDSGEYFEIANSYPRNHLSHKRSLFSLFNTITLGKEEGIVTYGSYKRCSQSITTTIGENGLEDGTSPVQTIKVGNINLIQSDNVINK